MRTLIPILFLAACEGGVITLPDTADTGRPVIDSPADTDDTEDPVETDEPRETDGPYNTEDPGNPDPYSCGLNTSILIPCPSGLSADECRELGQLYVSELHEAQEFALLAYHDIDGARDPFLRLYNAGYYFALVDQKDQSIREWQVILSALAKYATDLRWCLRGLDAPE